jgi:peroxiredoxin
LVVFLGIGLCAVGAADAFALKRMKGEPAASDFVLKDLDGKPFRLSDFRGKLVLLNFWATWCPTCARERPALERLYQTYRSRGFVILAVSIDRSRPENVKAFVKESRMSFPVLHDPDDRVSPDYWVQGIPTSVLVTPKGAVAYRVVGEYDWDGPEMRQVIEGLLPGVAR